MSARLQGPVPHEVIRALYRRLATGACQIINSGEEAHPVILVMTVSEHGTILSFDSVSPALVNQLQRHARTKDMLSAFIRGQLVARNADVIVHITEGWGLMFDKSSGDPAVALQRYKDMSASGVSIKDMPQRRDTLIVTMHVREGSCAGIMEIEPGPPRRVKLADLDLSQIGSEKFSGRLSLNPEGEKG